MLAKFCIFYPFFPLSNIVSLVDYTQNWNDLCQLFSNEYSKDSSQYVWVCLSLITHVNTCVEQTQTLKAEPPNLPILHLWFSQSGLQLLHYGKQQGQRSSLVATPSSKQRNQTKVLVNANLIHSYSLLVFNFELFLQIQSRKREYH